MCLYEVSNKQQIREKTDFFVGLLKAIEEKRRIRNPVYESEDPDLYQKSRNTDTLRKLNLFLKTFVGTLPPSQFLGITEIALL